MNLEDYLKNLEDYDKKIESGNIDDSFIKELDKSLKDIIKEVQDNSFDYNVINVNFKKTHTLAKTPEYAKDGDAGLDLTVCEILKENDNSIQYDFGLSFEIPRGYVGLLFPRSSVTKYDLIMKNCVGVIDSNYRGSVSGVFHKTTDNTKYNVGDRAAQLIIIPYPKINLVEKEYLSETNRGSDGFGSTGK